MRGVRRYIYALLALLVSSWAIAQDNITFKLNVPNRIVAGEPFTIEFVLNTSGKDMKMSKPDGLEILYGPATKTASSLTIINGKRTSSRTTTFAYTLLADSEGQYTIPEGSVTVGKGTYKTAPRDIKVFSAESAAGTNLPQSVQDQTSTATISSEDLFVTVTPSKRTVYEQEVLVLKYKLYSRNESFQFSGNVAFPEYEGFVKYPVTNSGQRQLNVEKYKDKLYYTVDFYEDILIPQRSGQLKIEGGEVEVITMVRVNTPVQSFFGSFRDQFQQVAKKLRIPPLTIDVKPLPSPKPLGFNGAVGQYKLTSEIPTNRLKTNESLTIKLTLEGNGNLKLTQLPAIEFPEGFEEYDPNETDNTVVTVSGISGSKSKEYYAVPRHMGDFYIEPIKFSYFDPQTAQFQTIEIPIGNIRVDKGEDVQGAVTGYVNKEDVKYLGQDIRYLKNGQKSTQLSEPKISRYVAVHIGLVALLLILIFADITRERKGADTASNRSRRAGKTVRKYLNIASKMRGKGEAGPYYEALLKGLNDYLSAKFHIPLSELSKENIRTTMLEAGVSEELTEETLMTLRDLEMARYTPAEQGQTQRDHLYDQAVEVIEGIQKTKLKKSII